MRPESDKRDRFFIYFVSISLLVHLLVFYGALVAWKSADTGKILPKERVIDLTLLPKKMDVVDIPPPKKEEVPEDAKNAALYNQKVKEEQVAKSPPLPIGDTPTSKASQTKPKPAPPKPVPATIVDSKTAPTQTPSEPQQKQSAEGRFGTPAYPEEFMPDYKIGSHTYVNALRYPGVSYFVELKRRFRMAFNPYSVSSVLRKNSRELVGRSSVDTVMAVTVNARGELTELFTIRESAVSGYDHFVEKVVRDSAPFTSPPAKLLDKDGVLRMSWTFQVTF